MDTDDTLLDQVKPISVQTFVIPGSDGKPRFVGKEDPNNPQVKQPQPCNHGSDTCSHMVCPKCQGYFDYLLGEGKEQGCEDCYQKKG